MKIPSAQSQDTAPAPQPCTPPDATPRCPPVSFTHCLNMDPVQTRAEQSVLVAPAEGVNAAGDDDHENREGTLSRNGINNGSTRRKASTGRKGQLSQSLQIRPPQSSKGSFHSISDLQFKSTNGLYADLHNREPGVNPTDHEVQSQHSDRSGHSSHSSTGWRTKTKRLFSNKYVPTTTPEDETLALPESEVERIVQRLEERNVNRVPVPSEVKARFLKMCLNVCRLRDTGSNIDCGCGEIKVSSDSPCILRSDVINMRNRVRLEVEQRSRSRRISDAVKSYFGFRCHSKVLLNVLNRAVDLIDASGHAKARERRRSALSANPSDDQNSNNLDINESAPCCPLRSQALDDLDEQEWFYYKDFSFYSMKVESSYPWMRSPLIYSVLLTISFYLMSPILWCSILKDDNICPASQDGMHNDWSSALYFSAVTMATVGYGDITVLVGENEYVDSWRIFIGILFMIISLVVSIVGFQAGLDAHFHPFRRKIDLFVKRAYDIVHEGDTMDKHDHVLMKMKWARISELAEITLIFFILNVIGVFALQIFVAIDSDVESISWMEAFYWAVQTTTTVGYGDVQTPESFRWFLLIYLAISTYFVGNALGKLRDLGKRLDSMQRLYLWQQQEASFEMLSDFSGRKDHATNDEGKLIDINPEIDQFEFTVASLVLLGKITSEDVKPIIKRFKELTSTNKITAADVAGPAKKKANKEVNVESGSQQSDDGSDEEIQSQKPSSTNNAVSVGKKIALAFREEVLSSSAVNTVTKSMHDDDAAEAVDYTKFTLPKNTYAIAIDDSKLQRKLLSKYFDFAGIPEDNCTIIGDGKDEIMGFEDFVVQFMEKHVNDFVLLIVDENLDVAGDDATKLITISGSECVEKIRSRLPEKLEKRMLALIRSANDSTSDVAIYKSRAHAFMPKAPIKKGGVLESLAPQWLHRFPLSEFPLDYSVEASTSLDLPLSDIACSPYDIAQKVEEINLLFQDQKSDTFYNVKEQLHELKGDILTLNSSIHDTPIIGLLNLILVAQSQETISDKWMKLRDRVQDMIISLGKNFRLPPNTYALAIDDSRIQRKLLSKFFDFAGIPQDQQSVLGERDEILSFEDTAVAFVESQQDNFVLLIVDENLDVDSEDSAKHVTLSGSFCVEKIRKRLSKEAERRMLALVRSANDSSSDVSLYNFRAHGFLPKAPIRREKINETLAPLWYKRFPPSEFGLSLNPGTTEDAMPKISEDVACSPNDIALKLKEIESLFENGAHNSDPRKIHDVLHELKGDLLTMSGFSASLIGILGQINLMLQASPHDPVSIMTKWQALCDRIQVALHSLQVPSESKVKPRNSKKFKRPLGLSKSTSSKDPLSSSFLSTSSDNSHTSILPKGPVQYQFQ